MRLYQRTVHQIIQKKIGHGKAIIRAKKERLNEH
jgi:hypothetical protein